MDERTPEILDQFAIQIARVVLTSGFYEDRLANTIQSVLGLTTLQTNALVRPMGARAKLELLERLAKASKLPEEQKRAIAKHAALAKSAFEDRNAIVHGHFGHNEKHEVTVRSFGGKEKLTGRPKRWTIDSISDVGSEINSLEQKLIEVCGPLIEAGPLPDNLTPEIELKRYDRKKY